MNQSQNNRLEMQQATDLYLGSNLEVWNTIPVVHTYKGNLSNYTTSIKEYAGKQKAAQVFISKSLNEQKKSIAEKMAILDDTVEVFAHDKGDNELLVKTKNSTTDYFKLPNEEFEIKVTYVISIVEESLADLVDYGITASEVEDVKEEFNDFQEKRGKPRAYRISSRVATQELKDLFDASATVLGKLDKILRRFKLTNPSFYNGYVASRMVVNK